MSRYSVYLVECHDGSLYTGIAIDVARRFRQHEGGNRGAKYLRGKGPLKLVYEQEIGDRSLASRVEARIKRMSRAEKTDLRGLPLRIDAVVAALGAPDPEIAPD